MEKKDKESPFLITLFNEISEKSINYCILRNYENLPYNTAGSDIDILVGSEQVNLFITLLNSIAKKYNGHAIVYYRSGDFYRLCYCNPNFNNGWGIQFDIHTDEAYRGLPYYDKQLLLNRSNLYNSISILNSDDAMVLALLKEALSNGVSRKGYLQKGKISYKKNSTHYHEIFMQYYGEKVANAWEAFLLSNNDNDQFNLKDLAKKTRRALLFKAITNEPIKTIKLKINYNLDRLSRIIKPIGFSVAFLGTDGAGKTTIINGVTPLLESALHTKLNYEHMRPNLLPSIAQIFGKGAHTGEPVTDPHAAPASGFFGSMLRLFYYSLDYIFGYWLKVYPRMVTRPCLYIFDRYFYDYLIDPYRSRIALSKKLIKLVAVIIPKPDLIICLGTDPETIHQRKPELPLEELKRQVNGLKELCENNKNTVWIDTGGSIENSVNNVLESITDHMTQRYKGLF